MNGKQKSQPIAFVIFLMLTFESQGQPTVDTSNPCENDSRLRSHNGGMPQLEENSLRDLVTQLVTKVNEQQTQLNALKQNNCSQNERLADLGQKITELKGVFIESRFHTERDNLAIRSQLNEMKKLIESMQQWNITLVERLEKLELENREQNEQLLLLSQKNESLPTTDSELHEQLSQMNSIHEQLILVNSSVQERADELKSLLSEHNEQLRLVQQQNAVQEEQLTFLPQLNASLMETVHWQEEMRASLNEINRTMEERIALLEQENRNREEQLKQTNGSLSRELAQLKEQNSQQRQQLANADKQSNDTGWPNKSVSSVIVYHMV